MGGVSSSNWIIFWLMLHINFILFSHSKEKTMM
jgi:hypothetical protein